MIFDRRYQGCDWTAAAPLTALNVRTRLLSWGSMSENLARGEAISVAQLENSHGATGNHLQRRAKRI
jgi:hypothetical protein